MVALAQDVTTKLPVNFTADLVPRPPEPSQVPKSLKLLTRLTLTISDPSQNHRLSTIQHSYDLLARGLSGGSAEKRRNLISGATGLIRATRKRGIIISSEARNALGVRAPWDLINLAAVWGLDQEKGRNAVDEEARKVVALARMKRESFRGVVDFLQDQRSGVGDTDQGLTVANGLKRKASAEADEKLSKGHSSAKAKDVLKREIKRRDRKGKGKG